MRDNRAIALAESLITHSVRLQPGENLLLEIVGLEIPLAREVVRAANQAKGQIFISIKDPVLQRELLKGASENQIKTWAHHELERMKDMQAYIAIRAGNNVNELSDVPAEQMKLYNEHFLKPVHFRQRVRHTKWCVLRYPNSAMAQLANMSTEAFEDFYYKVCTLDYAKMSRAMDSLVSRMERTDRVRIIGPGTDLHFSIKGMPAIKCAGEMNRPDGEVFTAPVKETVQGHITYNIPSLYQGYTFEHIQFDFRDGVIVNAKANNTARLNSILDTDQGARSIGEFAIGVNPYLEHPIKDILFDEKITGSFHFTPGSCYDECVNHNYSAIHWDLVSIQRAEYGGGEIWFDDTLIRKDGLFIVDDLLQLNPEQLK